MGSTGAASVCWEERGRHHKDVEVVSDAPHNVDEERGHGELQEAGLADRAALEGEEEGDGKAVR